MNDAKTKGQAVAEDVSALLRARNPLLWVVTAEEARVERYLVEAAGAAGYVPFTWDVAAGGQDIAGKKFGTSNEDPDAMLDAIRVASSRAGRNAWIMRDLPVWLEGPGAARTLRNLRNLVRALPGVARASAQAIIVLSPSGRVPPELANHATVIEFPLPDRAEVAAILDAAVASLPEFENGADGQPDPTRPLRSVAAPNGTRETAIDAAVGLSGEEAQACYARSLVQTRRIDPAAVAREKRRVVAREGVLEWYDPLPGGLDAVGGLDNLKAWLLSRGTAYTPAARAYGLPAPKGAMLVGIPGCLTGDTIINVCRKQRPGGYKGIRLDALFYRFNGLHEDGAKLGLYEKSKKWDLSITTRAHCYIEDKGYIGFNEIDGVIYSGVKEVFRLSTDHGNEIKATADHQFLTTRGYVRLDMLAVGEELLAYHDGVLVDDNSTGRNVHKAIRMINNVGNHPYARRRTINGLDYTSHPLHRLVVEADMCQMKLEEFLWAIQGDTTDLQFLDPDMEVHHRDEDRDNNMRSNLEVLTKADHARFHMNLDNANRYRCAPRMQKVASIVRIGKMPTYDIQMRTPNHNFVANGLLVHNCGKSLTAKAIATAWGCPLLKIDLGALKSKFVGESEGNLRKAFRVIETIGRCVVWFDEIEKAMQGATSGASDGGVSSDALGAVLSWMQERRGEAFVIATANDVESLPPELLRKGRFDEVWWVDLPNLAERAEILGAAMRTHGRAAAMEYADWSRVAAACEGFTGSEIAALVPDALFSAFADEGREISAIDLLAASRTVVPLIKTAGEKIAKLREWSKTRGARPATTPTDEAAARSERQIDL